MIVPINRKVPVCKKSRGIGLSKGINETYAISYHEGNKI
jgi:hypothetical protein